MTMPDGGTLQSIRFPVVPPLKWAGGKRWLVERILRRISIPYSRLIEPFAGSAAAFFALRPSRAILCDNNVELINTYKCIRWNHQRLTSILQRHAHGHCKEYYYSIRSESPSDRFERAARLLYLNRTCWNALYRVNLKGQFNVPIGTKTSVMLPTDDFGLVSQALVDASLKHSDFQLAIREAGHGDLIFADPPYFCTSASGTFVKYTNPAFSWADQERLARSMRAAMARGAHFVLTNADTKALRTLYERTGHVSAIDRHSVISGQPKGRRRTTELLWTSFPLDL